ncbi:hypothetical protein ACQU0X_27785 [Pseudovibrio ascidiaceicola]|uniref:hypothetical protein n=1 Tax=Pseudovibrio ascidiaceicola TaxID=285279 RepID=UPI003D35E1D5
MLYFSDDPAIQVLLSGEIPAYEDYLATIADTPCLVTSDKPRQAETSAALAALASLEELGQTAPLGDLEAPPVIVYLHCRYHADPRTAVLQHLLNSLQHHGQAHSLRISCQEQMRDALVFIQALLHRAPLVLLLSDILDLAEGNANVPHFQLLTRPKIVQAENRRSRRSDLPTSLQIRRQPDAVH